MSTLADIAAVLIVGTIFILTLMRAWPGDRV